MAQSPVFTLSSQDETDTKTFEEDEDLLDSEEDHQLSSQPDHLNQKHHQKQTQDKHQNNSHAKELSQKELHDKVLKLVKNKKKSDYLSQSISKFDQSRVACSRSSKKIKGARILRL